MNEVLVLHESVSDAVVIRALVACVLRKQRLELHLALTSEFALCLSTVHRGIESILHACHRTVDHVIISRRPRALAKAEA